MAIKKGKIITVSSVKGGVGKTTTLLNLAGVLSNKKKKVLIIDMDLYGSAIAASLNLNDDKNVYTLMDDLNNNRFDHIDNYITKFIFHTRVHRGLYPNTFVSKGGISTYHLINR